MEKRVDLIRHWLKALDVAEIYILGKPIWDWITVIGGPLIIAIGGFVGGFFLNRYLKDRDDKQREQDKKIEEDQLRQDALINYFNQMTQLLLREEWPEFNETSAKTDDTPIYLPIIALAKARTFAVLNELDGKRKGSLVMFLCESKAIHHILMENSNLSRANLHKTYLSQVNLSRANLTEANFVKADLFQAVINGANLSNAKLSNAYLLGADLSNTDLSEADLSGTNLSGANLSGANLSEVNLSRADLSRADLSGANLSRADLSRADLSRAILLNTDLRQTKNLIEDQFTGDEQPLICNSLLPQNIKITLTESCGKVATALHERHPQSFLKLEEAKKHVENQRKKKWD